MLNVKKRKRFPNRKWLVWAAAVVLVTTGILFAFYVLRMSEPGPQAKNTRGSLMNRNPYEIALIRIQLRGRKAWEAIRNKDGKLCMKEDAGWILDETLAERMEDAMAHLMYEDVLTEEPSEYNDRLAEFGLEDPILIASADFNDGTQITIRIGNRLGFEDKDIRFMTVDGDPCLYAVAGNVLEDLSVEPELLHPVIQPEIQTARIDRITILNQNGELSAEWALKGEITDSDAASNWQVTFPYIYPADQDKIYNIKKNVGNLRLGLFIAKIDEVDPAQYELAKPHYTLEIHLSAGSTGQITEEGVYHVQEREEETVRFLIGMARNEMTDYCLFNDAIYTVNHFTVSALTETDPFDTLARYPVTISAENLSSLEITGSNGKTDRYDLRYTIKEKAENDSADQETVVSCLKNGTEISQDAFFASYERWRTVNISGKLPDGWKKKESQIKYTFKTLSGKTHTVELSEFDAMHDAVTVDGWTLFYLIKGSFTDMP